MADEANVNEQHEAVDNPNVASAPADTVLTPENVDVPGPVEPVAPEVNTVETGNPGATESDVPEANTQAPNASENPASGANAAPVNESFIHKVEDEFKKVGTDVKDFVDRKEDEVGPQVKEDAHDVEVDAKDVEHDVAADVKQEEALASDAVHHPTHAPADAAEGVKDGEQDVRREATKVEDDVKTEVEKITEQLRADAKKMNEAGPGSELTENETPDAWANRFPPNGNSVRPAGPFHTV